VISSAGIDETKYSKIARAASDVQFRLPQPVFEILSEIGIYMYVRETVAVAYAMSTYPHRALVHMYSRLEGHERFDIEFVIAHEFAHIYLGHLLISRPTKRQTREDEIAANLQAETWGFEMPRDVRQTLINLAIEQATDPEVIAEYIKEQKSVPQESP
jgi:hypothetical protein